MEAMTPRTKDGFTLIELIVVIAVLAILAAVALPKFADFSTSAESAAFDGVAGGFTAAIGIVHSKWLADGKPTVVPLDGATVTVNAAGWPIVDNTTAPLQDTADELWGLVMAGATPTAWTGAQTTAVGFGVATFVQDASSDCIRYEATAGKVCVDTTGSCPGSC